VTLIVDTAPLVALADEADPLQSVVERLLREERGQLVLPAPVTAEVDYLLQTRGGRLARTRFLDDLAAGRFNVACLEQSEYAAVLRLDQQYADLNVGLADLSVVVLAHQFQTRRILTFDQRHFRVLRPLEGGTFELLPYDEPVSTR
jgi:predicted nucleic acid-binding protein